MLPQSETRVSQSVPHSKAVIDLFSSNVNADDGSCTAQIMIFFFHQCSFKVTEMFAGRAPTVLNRRKLLLLLPGNFQHVFTFHCDKEDR